MGKHHIAPLFVAVYLHLWGWMIGLSFCKIVILFNKPISIEFFWLGSP